MKITKKGFTLIELMIVIAIIAIIAAIAIPNLIEARKSGNESSAIGSLKTITTANVMFSESDKDTDGNRNFASGLAILGNPTYGSLIDAVLAGGTKSGYAFIEETSAVVGNELSLWGAAADPTSPGTTGDRYFFVNQGATILYNTPANATATAAVVDPFTPPATMVPVGK